MNLNTKEFAWSNVQLTLLTRTLTGLRGFECEKDIEKEYLYAAGDEPIDIMSGNKKYPLTLTVLRYGLDLLNDAAQAAGFVDILEVPHELIHCTIQFKKLITDNIRIISLPGLAFTNMKVAMQQNAKMAEVPLPGLAMRMLMLKK